MGSTGKYRQARIARESTRVTVLTYGRNVPMSVAAAEDLTAQGLDIEVVDLRSLHPDDWDAIVHRTRAHPRSAIAMVGH